MKQTPQDLTFFKNLSQTDTGRYLVDYLKRVKDYAYDSRSWSDKTTKESAEDTARLLQEFVIDKIHPKQGGSKGVNQFE